MGIEMADIEYEPFCANHSCELHKHEVPVGSKSLEYVDPKQFREMTRKPAYNASYVVSTVRRGWIYKNGKPLGQFCEICSRKLLGLSDETEVK